MTGSVYSTSKRLISIVRIGLSILFGGSSLFFGYHKALSPLSVLTENNAWTIHLAVGLGRAIGWLEMLAASALLLSIIFPRLARAGFLSAGWIMLNHMVAAVVHIQNTETETYRQSAILIPLCIILTALCAQRAAALKNAHQAADI